MRSTLAKNDLKYLNISIFDHFIPILRKNLRFEAKIKKKRTIFLSYIQISPKFDTLKTRPQILTYQIFFRFEWPKKKWSFFLFFFLKFHFFTFQVWTFWSYKITNLRLPKHNLGGYYYNKVVLEFWNFYFLGVKSAIFE